MLAYYPLEHIYYLCSHGIIPTSFPNPLSLLLPTAKPISLNTNAISMWSCRFWALYVVLQFAHLREDRKLLQSRERSLGKSKGKVPDVTNELEDLRQRWDSYWNELVVNVGYLPLTVHWYVPNMVPPLTFKLIAISRSLEKGLFKNDVSLDSLIPWSVKCLSV